MYHDSIAIVIIFHFVPVGAFKRRARAHPYAAVFLIDVII